MKQIFGVHNKTEIVSWTQFFGNHKRSDPTSEVIRDYRNCMRPQSMCLVKRSFYKLLKLITLASEAILDKNLQKVI